MVLIAWGVPKSLSRSHRELKRVRNDPTIARTELYRVELNQFLSLGVDRNDVATERN